MKLKVRVVCCGLLAVAVVAILASCTTMAVAQTSSVQTGNWSDVATWSAGVPSAALPTIMNDGSTVTIDQAGETTNNLDIGTASGGSGHLKIATGGALFIANNNNGTPNSNLPCIRVGQAAGSTGTLDMTDGSVFIDGGANTPPGVGELIVGDNGTGTMNLSGGSFHTSDEIWIGAQPTATGTVNVSGGTFQADGRSILVGFNGNGNLNVSGTGTVKANFDMLVGFLAGATSNINLSSGTIEANFLFTNFDNPGVSPGSNVTITQTGGTYTTHIAYVLGRGPGTTTVTHSGGTINCLVDPAFNNGDMVVSDGNGNTTTYNISGTATATVGRDFIVGTFGGSNGTVNQTGGAITVTRNIRLGAGSVGHWNLSGGTVNAANAFLGDFDSSNGFMKVSGGTLALTGNLSVGGALASNAPPAPVGTQGQALDANGTFTVSGSGGTINVGGNLLANPDDNSRVGGSGEHNDGALIFEVLNNSGVSRINVTGAANLHGADIDVNILGGSFPIGSTFDLITATSISHDWVQVPSDVGVFNLAIVQGGNGQILRATLVPEPATWVLLGCVAAAAVGVRLRKEQ